jgi:hypothetical protein
MKKDERIQVKTKAAEKRQRSPTDLNEKKNEEVGEQGGIFDSNKRQRRVVEHAVETISLGRRKHSNGKEMKTKQVQKKKTIRCELTLRIIGPKKSIIPMPRTQNREMHDPRSGGTISKTT